MIHHNIKQSWTLLKQHPLFSSFYITGSALAITATMVLCFIYYNKFAPIYPEYNRMNTSYVVLAKLTLPDGEETFDAFTAQTVRELFYPLQNVEAVSARLVSFDDLPNYVQSPTMKGETKVEVIPTDPGFFKIYNFDFIEGVPFTDIDFESGIQTAVITDKLSRLLFHATNEVVGREFQLNFIDYRVAGIVKGASVLTPRTLADIYIPYTTVAGYDEQYTGAYPITFLTNSKQQDNAMREELNERIRVINFLNPNKEQIDIWDQPTNHVVNEFIEIPSRPSGTGVKIRLLICSLLALLLVPALNLSALISGRMDDRLNEIGIRKSFGASKVMLLCQIVYENLFLTLLGGVLGLILSWVLIYRTNSFYDTIGELDLAHYGEVLFSPIIFIIALILCILLNVFSALIPAWRILRHPIVYALHDKL